MAMLQFMLGNLRQRKSYSIVTCVLVFLTGLILIVSLSTADNAGKAYDRAFANMKGPHLLYWFDKGSYREEFRQWHLQRPGVESVILREAGYYNGGYVEQEGKILSSSGDFFLFTYKPAERLRLIQAVHAPGQMLSPGEIYLPYVFRTGSRLSVGDSIDFVFGAARMRLKIAGFIEDPVSGGEMNSNKFLFISGADLARFYALGGSNTQHILQMRVHFTHDDEDGINAAQKQFMKLYGSQVNSVTTHSQMRNSQLIIPNLSMAVMVTFAVMLCLITVTIIRYAILSTIEADYTNIGIVKALGFTPRMVQLSITGQYVLLALCSGIASLGASWFIAPVWGRIILKSSGIYFSGGLSLVAGFAVVLALALVISVFAYASTRHANRISPVRAIARGIAPVSFSSIFGVRLERMGLLPLPVRMALKQLASKASKYVLLIAIAAMLAFTLCFSLGFALLFNSDKALNLIGVELSDIELDTHTKADAERILALMKQDYAVEWTTYDKKEQLDVEGQRTTVEIKDDFAATGQLTVLEGRHPKHDNEVALSSLLKKQFHKKIGDFIQIRGHQGKEELFLITGVFQTTDEGGSIVRMLDSGMRILNPDFELNEAYIKLKSHSRLDQTINEMKERYTGYDEISNERQGRADKIAAIKTVLSAFSKLIVALTVIVISVITLLITQITIYSETREIGIYKALGFSSNQIRLQLGLRFLLVTAAGGTLGVIAESLFGSPLFSLALNGAGISSWPLGFHLSYALLSIVIVSLSTLLTTWMFSGHIRRVSTYSLINE